MNRLAPIVLCAMFALAGGASAAPNARQELREVVKAKSSPDRGADLFGNCATCHGAQGIGAPDGSVPAIAGQHYRVIAKQLIDYRHAQRWDSRMERLADKHLLKNAQDIADVAVYASSLKRDHPADTGTEEWLQHGSEVYARACASCHGAAGEGDDKRFVPRLARQHYQYLLRQMYDTVEGRRPNMSADHMRVFKRFIMEDFEGVADYLSRLSPPSDEAP